MSTETSEYSPLQLSINKVLHGHLRNREKGRSRAILRRKLAGTNDLAEPDPHELSTGSIGLNQESALENKALRNNNYSSENRDYPRENYNYPRENTAKTEKSETRSSRNDISDRSIGFIPLKSKKFYRASSLRDSEIKKLLGDPLPLDEYTPLYESKKKITPEITKSDFVTKTRVERKITNLETNSSVNTNEFESKTPIANNKTKIASNKTTEKSRARENLARSGNLTHTLYLPKKKLQRIESNLPNTADKGNSFLSVSNDQSNHDSAGTDDLNTHEYETDVGEKPRIFENTWESNHAEHQISLHDQRSYSRYPKSRLFREYIESAKKNETNGLKGFKNAYMGNKTRIFAEKKVNTKQPLNGYYQDKQEETVEQRHTDKDSMIELQDEFVDQNDPAQETQITGDSKETNENQVPKIDKRSSFENPSGNTKDAQLLMKLDREIELESLHNSKTDANPQNNNTTFFSNAESITWSFIKESRSRYFAVYFFVMYFILAAVLYLRNRQNGSRAFNDINVNVTNRGSGKSQKFISFDYFYY